MDQITELDKEHILESFPGLRSDECFRITSDEDPKYNCIAWAFALYNDRWMQYGKNNCVLDGIYRWWPDGVSVSPNINSYIEAFRSKGFELCENCELEEGFVKIALYVDSKLDCTHASRQRLNGIWMSKLGKNHDIEHGWPSSVEGNAYGRVHCIMKLSRK